MQLHDFVLNLINDADARHAFELNPQACLDSAGLTDVTPTDVHDAIPLVADYAPARVAGLTAGLPDLTSTALDRVGALPPLGTGLSNGDLSLAAAGGVSGLASFGGDSTDIGTGGQVGGNAGPVDYSGGVGAGFDSSHDPAGTLDHAVPDGLVPHTVDSVTGTVSGTLDSGHGLTGTVGHGILDHGILDHGVLDPNALTSGVNSTVSGLDTHGLTGQLPGPGDHAAGVPGLDTLHGLTSTSGLLGSDDPLHLGGGTSADGSAGAHVTGDGHLPDVTHLF